jgi:hypothetical protein
VNNFFNAVIAASAWGQCGKGHACICYRLGIHQESEETAVDDEF